MVVINKIELLSQSELNDFKESLAFLKSLYIPIIYVSTKENINLELLQEKLKGMVSALGGPSGVGKSSIINLIQSDMTLEVGETSKKTSRGKHTTKGTNLLNLNVGGYIIDTPGFSSLELPPIGDSDELLDMFPEFWGKKCKFNDCLHINEPNCGVKEAVDKDISKTRYDFYCDTYNKLKQERWNKYD